MNVQPTDKVFQLLPYGRNQEFQCIIIAPESVSIETIQAAWSNAVRYTAKGLDLPDHELAIKRLQERHPTWAVVRSKCQQISIDLAKADNDIPDTQ